MKRDIWYISKYAVHNHFGQPTRQYFFSKYFAKKERNVTLISSRSNGIINKNQSLKFKNHFTFYEDNLKSVLINGPLITLGFNRKRIYSWIVFEIRTIIWALFFKKKKPEVIIVSSLSILTFITGSLLKRIYKCKLICEVRDIWPITLIESKNLNERNVFVKFLTHVEYVGYKNADIIVGSMPNLKEHISNQYPAFVSKVEYIPTGYSSEYFKNNIAILSLPFEDKVNEIVASGNFVVGYAGTIGFLNCVDEIIDAAKLLQDEAISFLIIGDGAVRTSLQKRVENENIGNVHFFGAVQKDFVQHYLKRCHLLINPCKNLKIYRFGISPNKWIDYMYSARPIVVSYNGYQNIINEAGCGIFIEANNPGILAQTILNFSKLPKDILEESGRRGKHFLEKNLSYETLSMKYLKIIDDL